MWNAQQFWQLAKSFTGWPNSWAWHNAHSHLWLWMPPLLYNDASDMISSFHEKHTENEHTGDAVSVVNGHADTEAVRCFWKVLWSVSTTASNPERECKDIQSQRSALRTTLGVIICLAIICCLLFYCCFLVLIACLYPWHEISQSTFHCAFAV